MEGIARLGVQGGERITAVHNPLYGDHFDGKCSPGYSDKSGPLGSLHRVIRPF